MVDTHQLVTFIFMEEQWLLKWSSDISVGGNALKVGSRKLGKLVLGQILLLLFRQGRSFI